MLGPFSSFRETSVCSSASGSSSSLKATTGLMAPSQSTRRRCTPGSSGEIAAKSSFSWRLFSASRTSAKTFLAPARWPPPAKHSIRSQSSSDATPPSASTASPESMGSEAHANPPRSGNVSASAAARPSAGALTKSGSLLTGVCAQLRPAEWRAETEEPRAGSWSRRKTPRPPFTAAAGEPSAAQWPSKQRATSLQSAPDFTSRRPSFTSILAVPSGGGSALALGLGLGSSESSMSSDTLRRTTSLPLNEEFHGNGSAPASAGDRLLYRSVTATWPLATAAPVGDGPLRSCSLKSRFEPSTWSASGFWLTPAAALRKSSWSEPVRNAVARSCRGSPDAMAQTSTLRPHARLPKRSARSSALLRPKACVALRSRSATSLAASRAPVSATHCVPWHWYRTKTSGGGSPSAGFGTTAARPETDSRCTSSTCSAPTSVQASRVSVRSMQTSSHASAPRGPG
mmetsp:Transcript_84064/g.181327  ORF Transcript_84064/g.181327 Transcript_84064/m.181327 type:complete len:457 (+) Transcript_84064:279-1649(+)